MIRGFSVIDVAEEGRSDFLEMNEDDFSWKMWERHRQRTLQKAGTGRQVARRLAHREVMQKKEFAKKHGVRAALKANFDFYEEIPLDPNLQLRHV